MAWPSGQDYNEAIQSPRLSLGDSELKAGTVECTPLGIPKPRTGAFATVYKVSNGSRSWAVRCFNRELLDQHERYEAISAYLKQIRLRYTTEFEFLRSGILVKGRWYPLLKMAWVNGDPLNIYIEKHLRDSARLLNLAAKWVQMARELAAAQVAHGDLQHGNVLIVGGELKLVDYDGMYVPSLRGKISNETGQANYQLPCRTAADFGPYLDHFSEWVVLISLLALAISPQLWQSLRGGDECLLFRKRDFEAPDQSPVIRALDRLQDQRLVALVGIFKTLLVLKPASIPTLDRAVDPSQWLLSQQSRSVGAGADWVRDHVAVSTSAKPLQPEPSHDWILDFTSPPPTPLRFTGSYGRQRSLLVLVLLIGAVSAFWDLTFGVITATLLLGGTAWVLLRAFLRTAEVAMRADTTRKGDELRQQMEAATRRLSSFATEQLAIRTREKEKQLQIAAERQELQRKQGSEELVVRKKYESSLNRFQAEKLSLENMELSELAALQRGLGKQISDLKDRIASNALSESRDLQSALKNIQQAFIEGYLAKHRISDAKIQGIGPRFTEKLRDANIHTAFDVGHAVLGIPGIGASRAQALEDWRRGLEAVARSKMPKALAPKDEASIRSKYLSERQLLTAELNPRESLYQSEQTSVTLKYSAKKQVATGSLAELNHQMQAELTLVSNSYKKQLATLSQQAQMVSTDADAEVAKFQRSIEEGQKNLSSVQWQYGKLSREAIRFSRITFLYFIRWVAVRR